MSYARVFLRGWSRREWLTVLVVAITAAFLLGTAFLLASAGAYTETLEDDLSGTATATEYDTVAAARAAADEGDVVVPLAQARVDGERVTVAGIPPDAPAVLPGASVEWRSARFPQVADGAVGPVNGTRSVEFVGESRTIELSVQPATDASDAANDGDSETILPTWWYATETSTVEQLGVTSVIVFDADGGTAGTVPTGRAPPPGTPLIAALPFLLAGVRQILSLLSVAALGGGVVVLVVVHSVTRMAIRDRHDDIRVVRATGASPLRLFAILCGRAAGLVVTGVGLGFGLGIVVTNAVTNLAVVVGLPVTLKGTVTPEVARLLAVLASVLIFAGIVAGALAARPAVREPPARLRTRVKRGRNRHSTPASTPRPNRTATDDGLPADTASNGGEGDAPGSDADGGGRTTIRGRRSDHRRSLGDRLRPTLLNPRAAIPTTATLTVFVFVVLLVGSLSGAFAPLTATESGTIVEAGAAHPLNSRVDASSATLLRSQGINASAEVIYAAVTDGQPYLVRGADYSAFAAVSDARLVAGHEPRSLDEAVIGADLADTLDVDRGDTILLGGSVSPGVRRVTVVGVFEAEGTLDDLMVVPLESVDGLSVGGEGRAHLIRTENLSAAQAELLSGGSTGVVVTGVDAPETVASGERFNTTVSVRNLNDTIARRTLVVRANGTSGESVVGRQPVTLDPRAERDVEFSTRFEEPGTHRLTVEEFTATVRVVDSASLTVPSEVPDSAPPGATLLVPAAAPNGSFVSGATVTVGSQSTRTGSEGVAVVRLPDEPGTYPLTVNKTGYAGAQRQLTIREGAPRTLSARLRVRPPEGTALTKPRVDIRVANPWGRRLNRTLTLVTPGDRYTRTVDLAGGEIARINVSATEAGLDERLPPGSYDLRLLSVPAESGTNTTLATATYRVRGDDRVLSVVASGGSYTPGTPVGQAIENVFGNVQVLFGAIVVLASLATIGGTTAAFAHAVHARGRTIGIRRATGATDRQILRVLVGDACRIAVPSTFVGIVVAVAAMFVLEASGLLVVFGIQLGVPTLPWLVVMVFCGGIVLSVVSVVIGGLRFLRVSPVQLLRLTE